MSYQKRLIIFLSIVILTSLALLIYFVFSVSTTVNNINSNDVEVVPQDIF